MVKLVPLRDLYSTPHDEIVDNLQRRNGKWGMGECQEKGEGRRAHENAELISFRRRGLAITGNEPGLLNL